MTYDPEGKLASDTTSAGTQTNVYDADDNLLLQTDPTDGSTLYVGGTELHEAPGSTTVTATRTYSAGSTPIAERTTANGTNTVYALNSDVDGTVDMEVNLTTDAVTRRYSDPFGNPLGSPGAWSDTHGFLNKSTSVFSGLTQVGARDYDPTLGRFLSVDAVLAPNNPIQNNGYSYGNNSPLLNMDPSGDCVNSNSDALSHTTNCLGGTGANKGGVVGSGEKPHLPPKGSSAAGNTGGSKHSLSGYGAPSPHVYVSQKDPHYRDLSKAFAAAESFNNGGKGGLTSLSQELATWTDVCIAHSDWCAGGLAGALTAVLHPSVGDSEASANLLRTGGGLLLVGGDGSANVGKDPAGTTTLYRAVYGAEADEIASVGAFRNPSGINSKYFTTRAGASQYAKMAEGAYPGDGPYSIVKTRIPTSILNGLDTSTTVDSGIPAYMVPPDDLPGLVPEFVSGEDGDK